MSVVLALVGAYLVGSFDFAVAVARMHGVDIRQVGSGNPGTSNVLRTLGKGPAAMVFVGDLLKGVIAAAMGTVAGAGDPQGVWAFAAGLAAVLGHCYPVFHRFRGGKGVATGAGVLLYTIPLGGLLLAALWGLIVGVGRVASIGSLVVVMLALPVAYWQGVRGVSLLMLGVILLLIVWRHRGNIARMLGGGESRVA
ncbi:MAG TPA: glycerol-3-phosphate 1-O-acyltransferase PlsY [Acidimicrobiia bacterium]|nr:glycerol-3-phosphate 1-O-acyltransferase PlsY [Acidimicrobiia bacterium]